MKMGRKRLALFAVAGAAVLAAVAGTASAAGVFNPSTPATPHAGYACVNLSVHTTFSVFDSVPHCTSGQTLIELGAAGARGIQGVPGTPGESLVSQTALGVNASVPTGGPFKTNSTLLGTVSVPNGTYRVTIDAKAAAVSTTQLVYPLIAVYDGAVDPTAATWWSNDLFNLGEGSLPLSTSIDQYIDGSEVVTVASGQLDIYGFGYTPGGAGGTFNLEGGTVTVTHVAAP